MFVERLILRAISLQEITTALDGDQILKDVCARLRQNLLIQEKPYSALVDELCIIKGVLPRGSRIVIPSALRQQVLHNAHEGHPGIVKMKDRL